MMPRIIASIEARMSSSRFPGKVLADVNGKPAIKRLVERLGRCPFLDGIILATTVSPADDVLAEWARKEGLECHRGSEEDVLMRVVEAQRKMSSDIVVEVTGDCTLLDPDITGMGIETFLGNDCDVVTNNLKASYPMGIDMMIFRLRDLEEVAKTVFDEPVREHVSLYFMEHPERYRIINLFAPARWRAPEYRFQLDYQEDYRFLNEVYGRLEPEYGPVFGIEEIMALLKREPWLTQINRECVEKAAR